MRKGAPVVGIRFEFHSRLSPIIQPSMDHDRFGEVNMIPNMRRELYPLQVSNDHSDRVSQTRHTHPSAYHLWRRKKIESTLY